MTALTTYFSNSTSASVPTACKLLTSTGGGLTNKNTRIGTNTGYTELPSLGNTAWSGNSTALPNPDDLGWLWDDTTLADNAASFSPGTWTATVRLNTSTGSIVANIHVRVYRRDSAGVFHTIVLMVSNGQTITATETSFTLSNTTSSASATFQPGDLLYIDQSIQITTNSTGSSTANAKTNVANSSTLGSTNAQVVSPGYTVVVANSHDATMRFRLSQSHVSNAKMRFKLGAAVLTSLHNATMRFKLFNPVQRNALLYFRTKQPATHNAQMRFRLAVYSHLALFPTAKRRAGKFPTPTRRQSV